MDKRKTIALAALFALIGLSASSKNTENPMRKYLESYYPSTGETRYEIGFSWGSYDIYTTGAALSGSQGNDARYAGYIVARPSVARKSGNTRHWTYLVTPGGKVWQRFDNGDIAVHGHRKQVRETIAGSVTARSTPCVESPAEPVIDDFLDHPDKWSRYGTLVGNGKEDYRLERMHDARTRSPRYSPARRT